MRNCFRKINDLTAISAIEATDALIEAKSADCFLACQTDIHFFHQEGPTTDAENFYGRAVLVFGIIIH